MRSRCTADKADRPKYGSSTLVPETTAVWPSWQRKIEKKEGGGEDADVKVDTTDKGEGLHKMVTSREEGRE